MISFAIYMPINLFYELKKYEEMSRPPRPTLIDAHAVPV